MYDFAQGKLTKESFIVHQSYFQQNIENLFMPAFNIIIKIFFIYWFSKVIQNMKKSKKNSDKFSYPHPIIKNFNSISQQKQHSTPPAYQNFHTSHPNTVSCKILRSTHIQPLLGSSFSLLFHPLHPRVQVNTYQSRHLLQCKKCRAVLSSTSLQKLSLLQFKCRFCSHIVQVQYGLQGYTDMNILDRFDPQKTNRKQAWHKKILFVIQANQLLYEKQIVNEIFQCLEALTGEQYIQNKAQVTSTSEQSQSDKKQEEEKTISVGFLFYDETNNYVLNMSTNQLIIFNPSNFASVSEFPLTQDQLLQPLNMISLSQIKEIANEIMYNSLRIKNSCLGNTIKICSPVAQLWQVQCKVFLFSCDTNMIQSTKKLNKSKQSQQISSFVQFYLLNAGLYTHMESNGLKSNVHKIYQLNNINTSEIYYQMYHNLTQESYYNAEISIICSSFIQPYKKDIRMPVITSNTPIILDFSIPNKYKKDQLSKFEKQNQMGHQCIQIVSKFKHFSRIVTYKLPKINTRISKQPFLLNDETFFYVMMCKMLYDKNIVSIKNALKLKSKQIVNRIMDQEQSAFYIPKNLTNFFMYAFLISEHELYEKRSPNCIMDKHQLMKEGLETIVKKIYPKVYEFYPEIKGLKFKSKSFLHDSIRIIDNGKFLTIVVGDEVQSKILMNVFGVRDIDDALEWKQVPRLSTDINKRLHDSIELLRQNNELYYLPLQIMRFDSIEFEETFGNYFYVDEDHCKFFNACFKG